MRRFRTGNSIEIIKYEKGSFIVVEQEAASSQATAAKHSRIAKAVTLFVVGVTAFSAYTFFRDTLSLDRLADQQTQLRQYQNEHPVQVYFIAFAVYATVTGLSLPGAAVLTLVYGWYFGLFRGVILVSIASTTGATLAFLLSRYLLRDAVQNSFGDRLSAFNKALAAEGAFYLFTLRLIPAVPFFIINVVMGLTPIRTGTYWWVSQLGMLPGTTVYVYAGSTFPDLKTLAERGVSGILSPQLIAAFIALGLFPLAVKKVVHAIRPQRSTHAEHSN